jgi:hypothetical protein
MKPLVNLAKSLARVSGAGSRNVGKFAVDVTAEPAKGKAAGGAKLS